MTPKDSQLKGMGRNNLPQPEGPVTEINSSSFIAIGISDNTVIESLPPTRLIPILLELSFQANSIFVAHNLLRKSVMT